MARNRGIKVEFWSDANLAQLSFFDRLFYIALWNYADDYGRGRALPKELAGFAFPHDDDVSAGTIRESLARLSRNGRVVLYEVDGIPYFAIVNWAKHQKVDHPSISQIPPPDHPEAVLTDVSMAHEPQAARLAVSRESRESLASRHETCDMRHETKTQTPPPTPPSRGGIPAPTSSGGVAGVEVLDRPVVSEISAAAPEAESGSSASEGDEDEEDEEEVAISTEAFAAAMRSLAAQATPGAVEPVPEAEQPPENPPPPPPPTHAELVAVSEPIAPRTDKPKKPKPGEGPGSVAFQAYAEEYRHRYGTEPVRNAKTNSVFKKLVEYLGDDAQEVARYYVHHNKRFYVECQHDPSILLRDCAGLHTQWKRGVMIHSRDAQEVDRLSSTASMWQRIAQEQGSNGNGGHYPSGPDPPDD